MLSFVFITFFSFQSDAFENINIDSLPLSQGRMMKALKSIDDYARNGNATIGPEKSFPEGTLGQTELLNFVYQLPNNEERELFLKNFKKIAVGLYSKTDNNETITVENEHKKKTNLKIIGHHKPDHPQGNTNDYYHWASTWQQLSFVPDKKITWKDHYGNRSDDNKISEEGYHSPVWRLGHYASDKRTLGFFFEAQGEARTKLKQYAGHTYNWDSNSYCQTHEFRGWPDDISKNPTYLFDGPNNGGVIIRLDNEYKELELVDAVRYLSFNTFQLRYHLGLLFNPIAGMKAPMKGTFVHELKTYTHFCDPASFAISDETKNGITMIAVSGNQTILNSSSQQLNNVNALKVPLISLFAFNRHNEEKKLIHISNKLLNIKFKKIFVGSYSSALFENIKKFYCHRYNVFKEFESNINCFNNLHIDRLSQLLFNTQKMIGFAYNHKLTSFLDIFFGEKRWKSFWNYNWQNFDQSNWDLKIQKVPYSAFMLGLATDNKIYTCGYMHDNSNWLLDVIPKVEDFELNDIQDFAVDMKTQNKAAFIKNNILHYWDLKNNKIINTDHGHEHNLFTKLYFNNEVVAIRSMDVVREKAQGYIDPQATDSTVTLIDECNCNECIHHAAKVCRDSVIFKTLQKKIVEKKSWYSAFLAINFMKPFHFFSFSWPWV